jgi:signal transduction histidine kinase
LREESAEHFGLRGMQERARALGGTFDAFSRPAAGTSIVVDIPVQLENGARGWSES